MHIKRSFIVLLSAAVMGITAWMIAQTVAHERRTLRQPTNEFFETQWAEAEQLLKEDLPQSALQKLNKLEQEAKRWGRPEYKMKAVLERFKLHTSIEWERRDSLIADLLARADSSDLLFERVVYRYAATEAYSNDGNVPSTRMLELTELSDDDLKELHTFRTSDYPLLILTDTTNVECDESIANYFVRLRINLLESTNKASQALTPSDTLLLGSREAFMALPTTQLDSVAPIRDALVRSYQQLIRLCDENAGKELRVDVERLKALQQLFTGDMRSTSAALYARTLDQWRTTYDSLPEVVEVVAAMSHNHSSPSTPASEEARVSLLTQYIDRYPTYQRINLLKNERAQLTAAFMEVSGPSQVGVKTAHELQIAYAKVKEATMEIYRVESALTDRADFEWGVRNGLTDKKLRLSTKPLLTKRIEIPYSYHTNKQSIKIAGLPEGAYIIQFRSPNTPSEVLQHSVWVTPFRSILRTGSFGTDILVADFLTGAPAKGIKVNLYSGHSVRQKRKLLHTLTTDAHGRMVVPEGMNAGYYAVVVNGSKHNMMCNLRRSTHYSYDNNRMDTHLYIDRPAYKPGQTLHYKVIVWNPTMKRTEVGHEMTLRLIDSENKEVQTLQVMTNEMGSASGEIKLPADRRNGTFRLMGQDAGVYFPVEEYKRPSLSISLDRPILLNEGADNEPASYKVTGKVLTTNGIGLQNSVVRYSIKHRQEQGAESSVRTDSQGRFELQVTLPLEEVNPYYRMRRYSSAWWLHQLECSVTDAKGETQTQTLALNPTTSYGVNIVLPTKCFASALPAMQVKVERFALSATKVKGTWSMERKQNDQWSNIASGTWAENEPTPLTPHIQGKEGEYKLSVKVRIAGRDSVMATHPMTLITPHTKRLPSEQEFFSYLPTDTVEMGTDLTLWLGSSNPSAQLMVEVFKGGMLMKRDFVRLSNEIMRYTTAYEHEWGTNVSINLTMIGKKGAHYSEVHAVEGRQPSKKLTLHLTGITRKAMPDAHEEWRIKATDAEGNPVRAELMATLYDKSLEQLGHLYWNTNPFVLHRRFVAPLIIAEGMNNSNWLNQSVDYLPVSGPCHRTLLYNNVYGYAQPGILMERDIVSTKIVGATMPAPQKRTSNGMNLLMAQSSNDAMFEEESTEGAFGGATAEPFKPRSDFRESIFFYGRLLTDTNGEAALAFTVPQALTSYQLRLLGHTSDLMSGYTEEVIEVTKPLMVTVNAPRFAYEGDSVWIKAIVFNQSNAPQQVRVGISTLQEASLKEGEQREFSFLQVMPSAGDSLRTSYTFTVQAITHEFTDSEAHTLPLLARRQQVSTTSLHNFPQGGTFSVARPFKEARIGEVRVDYVPSPVYMLLDAMPTAWIPQSNSFFSWLHSYYIIQASDIILQRYATITSQRVDPTTLTAVTNGLLALQASDGGFSWFDGMPASLFLTLTYLENTARLQTDIGFDLPERIKRSQMAALSFADRQMGENYRQWKSTAKDTTQLVAGSDMIFYLAVRGRFTDVPLHGEVREAHRAMLQALTRADLRVPIDEKPNLAAALWRYDRKEQARKVAASLEEYTVYSAQTGRYYGNNRGSSTQSMRNVNVHTKAMEAMAMTGKQGKVLREMSHWLLRQKQGQQWSNELTTVNALNTLLCYGIDQTTVAESPSHLFEMNLPLLPSKGTSAKDTAWKKFSATYSAQAWNSQPSRIEVKKKNNDYTWLTATWSRMSPLQEVNRSEGDLQIRQTIVQNGKESTQLKEGNAVVRITITSARDLDFVVLHSPIAACMEPTSYRSGYESQGAHLTTGRRGAHLWFYREVKENGTNLYIQHLPKGEYTVEVPYHVVRSGEFSQGVPTAESFYSSDFKAVDRAAHISVVR